MSTTQQAVPFRSAAGRNRWWSAYVVPWVSGSRPSIQHNNRGYLNGMVLRPNISIVVGTGGTVTDAAQANSNYFPFVGLRSPEGEYIWTTNSRDLYDFNYRLFGVVTIANQPTYATWTPGSAATYPVNLNLYVPVALNDGFNFDVGLLMRQISNIFYYLELQHANPSDLVGSGTSVITSITGNTYVGETYYDAIDPNANPPVTPPSFSEYVRLRSLQSGALLNGQNDLSYAVGPVLTDIFLRVMNNSIADGTITNLQYIDVQVNKNVVIDHRSGDQLTSDFYMHYGVAARAGVYHEDFFDDRGGGGGGFGGNVSGVNVTSGRDFINSNKAAQLDFNVYYGGTPSGSSWIQQFFREIIATT